MLMHLFLGVALSSLDMQKDIDKHDLHAVLQVYLGKHVSILHEYDVYMVATEIITDMQDPSFPAFTVQFADEDRSTEEANLAQYQRAVAKSQMETQVQQAYRDANTDTDKGGKGAAPPAVSPPTYIAPPCESWSAARPPLDQEGVQPHQHYQQAQHQSHELQEQQETSKGTGKQTTYDDSTTAHHQQKPRSEPTAYRGGKGPLGHLLQVVPDAARTDADHRPKPGITASTTGIHHHAQPSVWAKDSTASPSSPAHHSGWNPSTSDSSFAQRDRPWPTWAQTEVQMAEEAQ